jgi:hypothetical protein
MVNRYPGRSRFYKKEVSMKKKELKDSKLKLKKFMNEEFGIKEYIFAAFANGPDGRGILVHFEGSPVTHCSLAMIVQSSVIQMLNQEEK